MKIAIVGHGNVGGALARAWASAGHQLIIGARNVSDETATALARHKGIRVSGISEAVEQSDVILVATPPEAALSLVKDFGGTTGKTIIDASNAIKIRPDGYPTAFHAFEALTHAEVVKCFNTTGFENMSNPLYGNTRLDMYMAGSKPKAKQIATQLAKDCGFESCIDFGGSDKVVLLEQFALSWINLALMQGLGRNIGFKLLRR